MTSLVAWIAIDARAPSSIYLASDSRISWNRTNGLNIWNYGRKLFASTKYPEIIGYVGDVLFPSQVLGQLIDLIDGDVLFKQEETPQSKWNKIHSVLASSFQAYPHAERRLFTVMYCTRENSGMASQFHMFTLSWKPDVGWFDNHRIDLPEHSGIIGVFGSGEHSIRKWYSYWNKTTQKRTSRIVFSAFCDALNSGEDKFSGGPPQLVGLYRKGAAESFGVIYQSQRYLLGIPISDAVNLTAVEWRNTLFERCNGTTMEPLQDAQRHARPRGLGK